MSLPTSLQRTIKEKIRDRVSALPSVYKAYTFEKFPFDGFPTVTINNGDVEGEFWSTAENRRIYGYRIRIWFQVGQTPSDASDDRMQNAEEVVAKVAEEIMNALDSDFELGQYNADVLYLDAVDMINLDYTLEEGGFGKVTELTVRVHTDYSV